MADCDLPSYEEAVTTLQSLQRRRAARKEVAALVLVPEAAPPKLVQMDLDDDKLDAIWEWADADGDGFLSRAESDRLQQATEGRPLEDGQYAVMCEELGVQDPAIGVTFAQYKQVYLMEMGNVDADYDAIFRRQPQPAPPPPASPPPAVPALCSAAASVETESARLAAGQLKAIWSWADFDGDGHLNRQEVDRLSMATDGRVVEDEEFSDMCKQFGEGVVDQAVGLNFEQYSMIYELDIESVAKDHAALFSAEDRSAFLKAIWSWADQDGDGFLNQDEADRLQAKTEPAGSEGTRLASPAFWAAACLTLEADPSVGLDYDQMVRGTHDPLKDFEIIFGTVN
jgi:hypothetical protein